MTQVTAQRLRQQVAAALAARLRADEGVGTAELAPEDEQMLGRHLIAQTLEDEARAALAAGIEPLSTEEEERLARAAYDELFGLGALEPLLADDAIENVNVNGCDRVWLTYADGHKEQAPAVASSDEELVAVLRAAAARLGLAERRFDVACPRLSLQLADGSRLFAVMAVTPRPCVSLRRHRFDRLFLTDLVANHTVSDELAALLAAAVRAGKNLIVCGGADAGKTTLLRALANEIAPQERLITIEDSLELGLDRFPDLHPDVIPLEAREANVEGEGVISQADLVRWALRMDPDRVIVGEVRGDEVLPMLNAMSQGNDGSMCSLHANSSSGAFGKLAMYAVQAPERLPLEATNLLVANAVDFVIHLAKAPGPAGTMCRAVASVREVTGAEGSHVISNEVFAPGRHGRARPAAPVRAETIDQLVAAGFVAGTHSGRRR